jgi:spore coat-associated protein N
MHKPLNGAIALGAAGLLLLGGAGTYALWSDSVDLEGGTIDSGRLEFVNTTAGVWRDVSDSANPAIIPTIADFLIVPGDVLTYTISTTLRAQGDNLEATIEADESSITGDPELLADVDVTTAVTTTGGATIAVITEANDNAPVTVVVTLTFDEASTNETQLESINLSALELTVNQNPR